MSRGELRVYLGAAPGVGKTFAMLHEGRRRVQRGTDVVVAYVETHGRELTTEAIGELEVVPRRRMTYRGADFEEMDLDAILARAPQVALVDELAHTNVPGSRNEKRWQDIEELVAAGVTVISTVNIQHLESLNDVIERITGTTQRETVPDAVVRAADQVELVDMTPEALRRRMAHGNIYAAEKVDAALGHYFRSGNLAALRELALLWVADRVDEGLAEYRERHGITETWETRERVVVALTGAPGGEQLIRRGSRMAARSRADLVGVHVRRTDGRGEVGEEQLAKWRRLLDELGGRYAEVTGDDVGDALVRFARAEHATQLILGRSARSRWAELTHGSIVNRVIRTAGTIDVHVISTTEVASTRAAPRPPRARVPVPRSAHTRLLAWGVALVVVPLTVLALVPVQDAIGVPGSLLLLLLVPVGAAMLGGLLPALAASAVAFLLADWFLIAPTHDLGFAHAGDALALLVFVAVSSLVSGLVDRLARRRMQLAQSHAESEALAELASGTALLDAEALHRLVNELRDALDLDSVAVLRPTPDGWLVDAGAGEPVACSPEEAAYSAELGDGTVLAVAGPSLPAEDRRLLNAFVGQICLAQRTLQLQVQALAASGLADSNRLRESLLAAVSHDLRGPLASIKVAATSLLTNEVEWPPADVRTFAATIDLEADRLHSLVCNLLDLGRLRAGMLGVLLEACSVEGVVCAALASLSADVDVVDVEIPDDLPPVLADPALLERAIANVVMNALSWAPDGTRVRVVAGKGGGKVHLRVVDRGAGVPRDRRAAVFEPFQRLGDGGRAAYDGIGLGLAVTKGFVESFRGEVVVEDTPGGGATFDIVVEVAA